MLSKKEIEDLNALVANGKRQAGRLSSMIVTNFFVSMATERQTDSTYNEIIRYLEKSGITIESDELEIEGDEESSSVMPEIRPFDPSKIDVDMKTMELSSIIKRLTYNEINMHTGFQRKSGLWSPEQKSRLIESLLLRIPIQAFYFDGGVKDNWLVIDGLQRLTAVKEFVVDETLKLVGLEFFKDLNGAKFRDLPRTFVRRIEESNIIAYIVRGETPPNVKYNIFKRINTGGLQLTPQEIRHALYQGKATDLCKNLAKLKEFRTATTYSIRDDRMMDQEFVLRFIAVCYYGIDKYEGVPDNYLNGAMEYLNSKNCVHVDEIEQQFKRVMIASNDIMGKYAFRKLGQDGIRRPINKAIYEAWCKSLFDLDKNEIAELSNKRDEVYDRFLKLSHDSTFLQAIKASDKKSFLSRFTKIKDMLLEVLDVKKN